MRREGVALVFFLFRMQSWNWGSYTWEASQCSGIHSSSPTSSPVDTSATFPFLQITGWEKTVIFFLTMLVPLRNQVLVSYLRQCLQSITSTRVSWRDFAFLCLCEAAQSGTVFPTMQQISPQVWRICWRCYWGGCSVMIRNYLLYRPSWKQSITATTVRRLLQVVQSFSSMELLFCCNQLPSTSTQHVLNAVIFPYCCWLPN